MQVLKRVNTNYFYPLLFLGVKQIQNPATKRARMAKKARAVAKLWVKNLKAVEAKERLVKRPPLVAREDKHHIH